MWSGAAQAASSREQGREQARHGAVEGRGRAAPADSGTSAADQAEVIPGREGDEEKQGQRERGRQGMPRGRGASRRPQESSETRCAAAA